MFPSCVPPPNNISFKATAKKKKETCSPSPAASLPFSLPPIIPCALLSPPPKKLLITRQRSVIKTHVYTRVSFMDQDLEKEDGGLVVGGGGADTWAQCQPCRATSNRRLFPLSFPGPEHSADEAKKRPTMLLFSTLFHCSRNRRSATWRHLKNRSDKEQPSVRINTVTADGEDIPYQSFLPG